jgi:hypothetical protein
MQELVEQAAKVTGVLEINRNDMYNKVRRVKKERKAAAHANVCATVSPEMSKLFAVQNTSVVMTTVSSNEASPSPSSPLSTSIPSHEEAAILSGTSGRESGNPPPPSNIAAESTILQQNMGGQPKGSSNVNKWKNELKWKQATNWVVLQYSEEKENAEAANDTSTKGIRVRSGMLKELIEEAKATFGLTSDFNVPFHTIVSCIKSGNLEVLHPGEKSLLLHVEVVLEAYLITELT